MNNQHKVINLNISSVSCTPCKNTAIKMQQKISKKKLNEIKINKIKEIVNSMFDGSKNGN